jgi:hypothetical protein
MFLPRHNGCGIRLNTLLDLAQALRIDEAICLFSPYVFITLAELSIDKNTSFLLFREPLNNIICFFSLKMQLVE